MHLFKSEPLTADDGMTDERSLRKEGVTACLGYLDWWDPSGAQRERCPGEAKGGEETGGGGGGMTGPGLRFRFRRLSFSMSGKSQTGSVALLRDFGCDSRFLFLEGPAMSCAS